MPLNQAFDVLPCVPTSAGTFFVNVTITDLAGYVVGASGIPFVVHDPGKGHHPVPSVVVSSASVNGTLWLNATLVRLHNGHYANSTAWCMQVSTALANGNWTTTITLVDGDGQTEMIETIVVSIVNGAFVETITVQQFQVSD